ncbi:MAG: protein kinase [Myxococcales bacterium]|nr:protein kinase [Myxococcales bacterium]
MKICETCHKQFSDEGLATCPDDGGRLFVVGADPLIGQTIDGRFVIDALIGSGGMGRVYLAHQASVERPVALKVLRADISENPLDLTRFFREAKAASKLNHPNSITVHDFGQGGNGLLYLVMEWVDGEMLRHRLRQRGRMSVEETLEIAIQICHALEAAHDLGIVHRDLKPDNIMLCEKSGYRNFVKVLDFGLAKLRLVDGESVRTRSGVICGTPQYMSPEQARGDDVDGRSDIYALGVILYELLCGVPPFRAESASMLLVQQIQDDPIPLSRNDVEVPRPLERVVMRCLAKNRAHRPQTAAELRRQLEELTASLSGGRAAAPGSEDELVDDTLSHEDLDAPSPTPQTVSTGERVVTETYPAARRVAGARPLAGSSAPDSGSPVSLEDIAGSSWWRRRAWWLVAMAAITALVVVVAVDPFGRRAAEPERSDSPRRDGSRDSVPADVVAQPPPKRAPSIGPSPPRVDRRDVVPAETKGRGDIERPRPDQTSPMLDAGTVRKPVTAGPTSITIEITSTPTRARVYRGKSLEGTTPLTLHLRVRSETFWVRLEKSGFKPQSAEISQKRSQRLHYTLEKRRRRDNIFRPLER